MCWTRLPDSHDVIWRPGSPLSMPNRQLTDAERATLFAPLIAEVRARLDVLSGGDTALLWALRRKLAKELSYDERGKPMHRVMLKMQKRIEQANRCAMCSSELP